MLSLVLDAFQVAIAFFNGESKTGNFEEDWEFLNGNKNNTGREDWKLESGRLCSTYLQKSSKTFLCQTKRGKAVHSLFGQEVKRDGKG